MAGRRKFSHEFKLKAVRLVTQHGLSVSEAANTLGIHANVLRKWKTSLSNNDSPPAESGNGLLSSEQEELLRLREENKRLRMERDILKKATALFASDSLRNSN